VEHRAAHADGDAADSRGAELERAATSVQAPQASDEERLAKDLENSRYQDLP